MERGPVTARLAVFDAVIEHMPSAVLIETARRRIFAVNSRFCEIFGFPGSPETLVDADCAQGAEQIKHLLAEPDAFPRRIADIIQGGQTVRGEEVRFADGRITERDYVPVRDRDGTLVGHIWQYRDVTERRAAEEALRRSEADYRDLFEHAVYGIYRSTADGRLLKVNSVLVEMLGYESAEDLLGRDMAREVYAHEQDRDRLIARFREADRFESVVVTWKRKDGSPIPVRLRGRAVRDAAGRLEGFETFVEDVTTQRTLEDQLRQSQKMEAIGQLTGGIAHDFNNLLSVILSNTQLLAEAVGKAQPDLLPDLRDVATAAERAAALTRRLLQFSRRAELHVVPTDLRAVVTGIVPMIRRIIPENIRIQLSAERPVGAVSVDTGAVEQILLNLIGNARDAMPDGGDLRVEVRETEFRHPDLAARPWMRPGRYVTLTVTDTGVGMDEQTVARVFEPFFTTKAPGEGTGLGMAMVYGLTKQQRGHVDVESAPRRGTAVRLHFPVSQDPAPASGGRVLRSELPRGSETVLLVEDEAALRRTGRRILERYGYRVIEAASAEEALEVYRGHTDRIHLVVCDQVLPGLTGQELRRRLIEAYGEIKFLLTTGYARRRPDDEDMDPSVQVVRKPWELDEFLTRIRDALG